MLPIENRTQLRILKTLTEIPTGLNLGQLQKKLNTTYKVLARNLEELKQKELIEERRYGKRIRIFQLNKKNPKTKLIIKLFTEEEE